MKQLNNYPKVCRQGSETLDKELCGTEGILSSMRQKQHQVGHVLPKEWHTVFSPKLHPLQMLININKIEKLEMCGLIGE